MLNTASTRYFSVLLVAFLVAAPHAQQPEQPSVAAAANSFVQDVLTRAGSPSSVNVIFQNVSSLPAEAQEAARNAIFTSFRNAGVRLVKAELALAEVKITFSEDWQSYVWIAVVQQGPSSQMVMKRFPRQERTATPRTPTLTVRKNLVWQQDVPILDFFQDNQTLAVLEPGQITLYANDSGQWQPRTTLAVAHAQAWPRDLRGRLQVNGRQITAFLPGTLCTGILSPPSLDCRSSDDPWPLDQGPLVAFFNPRRNYFSGILAGPSAGASVAPFFSAAAWPNRDQRHWLFTGTDGRTRLYQNDLSAPAAVFNDWGSNLAAVHSNCGSGWQLLVSAPTDSIRPDSVQAVEIAGREAQPVSSPIELAGGLSALWTAGKNNEMVNAVMQSTATGKYEAFTLTVTCN
jgi:hypothetical protein